MGLILVPRRGGPDSRRFADGMLKPPLRLGPEQLFCDRMGIRSKLGIGESGLKIHRTENLWQHSLFSRLIRASEVERTTTLPPCACCKEPVEYPAQPIHLLRRRNALQAQVSEIVKRSDLLGCEDCGWVHRDLGCYHKKSRVARKNSSRFQPCAHLLTDSHPTLAGRHLQPGSQPVSAVNPYGP